MIAHRDNVAPWFPVNVFVSGWDPDMNFFTPIRLLRFEYVF